MVIPAGSLRPKGLLVNTPNAYHYGEQKPETMAPERQHWMKLLSAGWAGGAAWGAPRRSVLLANLAACTHGAPAHTHAPDKHRELAGRGQGASSATPGRVHSSTGMLAARRCHDWRETRRKKLLRSLLHFTCCEQRHLLNTQSAKAAEPPFTVTTGEKQNSNRNPQKNTSGKSEQAGHLHGDRGRCGFPPEQSSAERHN